MMLVVLILSQKGTLGPVLLVPSGAINCVFQNPLYKLVNPLDLDVTKYPKFTIYNEIPCSLIVANYSPIFLLKTYKKLSSLSQLYLASFHP